MRLSLAIASALLFGSYVAAMPTRGGRSSRAPSAPPPVYANPSGPDIFGTGGQGTPSTPSSLFGGMSPLPPPPVFAGGGPDFSNSGHRTPSTPSSLFSGTSPYPPPGFASQRPSRAPSMAPSLPLAHSSPHDNFGNSPSHSGGEPHYLPGQHPADAGYQNPHLPPPAGPLHHQFGDPQGHGASSSRLNPQPPTNLYNPHGAGPLPGHPPAAGPPPPHFGRFHVNDPYQLPPLSASGPTHYNPNPNPNPNPDPFVQHQPTLAAPRSHRRPPQTLQIQPNAQGKFDCELPGCGKSFSRKQDLSRHSGTVHGIGGYSVSCPDCGATFPRNDYLQRHQSQHTPGVPHAPPSPQQPQQPRKHECEMCDKTFSRSQDLQRHQGAHNRDRPFACPDCDKSYKRRHDLAGHQRKTGHGSGT